MSKKIQIKRGLKVGLPTLNEGELGYATDTKELFIGTASGNELINEDSTINTSGDVNVSNLSEGDILIYDGTNWVNRVETPTILGVEWDQDTDSLTRLDDAVGLTAGGDFNNFNHYQLKRCMVNDDLSINYYIDPTDPTKIGEVVNTGTYTTGETADYTGSHGQVMVEIPKFWWKTDEPTSEQYQWRISDIAQSGFSVHPAFITDGVTKDYIYIGAFEASDSTNTPDGGTGTLRSVSEVGQLYNRDITQFRSQAQARGAGWQIQTYWGIHALQMLYLIEYADFDTQTTIGRGVVDISNNVDTGDTISLGNSSGMASGTDGEVSISYRGVEDFWGNMLTWTDGLNSNNGEGFVANKNFASDVFSGDYTSIGQLLPDTGGFQGGYASDIKFPHFLATEVSGSDTSFLHDRYFQNTGQTVAAFGGSRFDGSVAGGFFWDLAADSSRATSIFGSRLQIL